MPTIATIHDLPADVAQFLAEAAGVSVDHDPATRTATIPVTAINRLADLSSDRDGHYDGQYVWIGGSEYAVTGYEFATIDPRPASRAVRHHLAPARFTGHIHASAVWYDDTDPDDGDEQIARRVHDRIAVSRDGAWVEIAGDDAWTALVAACAAAGTRPEITLKGAMAGEDTSDGVIEWADGGSYKIQTVRRCDGGCGEGVYPLPLYAPLAAGETAP